MGRVADDHLVQHRAQAVHVGATVHVRVTSGLLGTDVARRADQDTRGGGVPGRRSQRPGDNEVGDDGLVAGGDDVLGLHVAVQDLVLVRVAQRRGDSAADPDNLVERGAGTA